MADMKEAPATVGVAPERIHVELFNGSVSMTPGVVRAATRAAHVPQDDADTGPLVSFARKRHRRALEAFLPEHFGTGRGMRRSGPLVVPDGCLSQL